MGLCYNPHRNSEYEFRIKKALPFRERLGKSEWSYHPIIKILILCHQVGNGVGAEKFVYYTV